MLKKGFELSDAEIARGYEKIAADLAMPWYFYNEVASLSAGLAKGRVLDIGCGNGFILKALSKKVSDIEVFGFDNTFSLAKATKKRLGEKANILRASANCQLPFIDNSFDLILSTDALEHLKDPSLLLKEIHRLLKPGGRAVITIPNGSSYMPFMSLAAKLPQRFAIFSIFVHGEHPVKTPQPIAAVYFFNEITQMLQRPGFRIVEINGFESFPYFFDLIRWGIRRIMLRPFSDICWKFQFFLDRTIGVKIPRLLYRLVIFLEPENKD